MYVTHCFTNAKLEIWEEEIEIRMKSHIENVGVENNGEMKWK